MVNHVRTLLLNRAAGGSAPGEEYVPRAFRPVALSGYLQAIHKACFGPQPDRAKLNYRLRQFMALIHDTELDQYARHLDRRLTYLPFDETIFYFPEHPTVTKRPASSPELTLLGTSPEEDSAGRLQYSWRLEAHDLDEVTYEESSASSVFTVSGTITARQITPHTRTVSVPVNFERGLSEVVDLPGSQLQVRIATQGLGEGAGWDIHYVATPKQDLASLLNTLAVLGVQDELFGTAHEEPYKTFLNLWRYHEAPAQRLGAFLMAVAYRTEEHRTRQYA